MVGPTEWPAELVSRYRIEHELGSGAMATVYLAQDLKHDRPVALKILKAQIAAALGVERFLREIQITARLNHPHILTLIDSGEAQGIVYYAMPHMAGGSLRERLNRDKQLTIEGALRITRQIAAALDYAHRQSVVHRDIKPENILFHEGEAMVADFGIAVALTAASGDNLTETGISLGTPAYMSPEQAAGSSVVDGRSDLYSLACVLYEMLAGHPPFLGASVQEILTRHLLDHVPSLKPARSSIPDVVERTVLKALAKVPIDRFATAGEFATALQAPVAGEPVSQARSIVVLPFSSLGPDVENEYFADGLTEEIITDLSKVQALRVISRNSALQLKRTTKDTKTIGRELNVQYVLEGSVRKWRNTLRVTAQLIDATSDVHLWAEKYSGELEDVFDIQEKLSRTIVDALKVKLSPEEDRRIRERPIDNVQAYECYLGARQEVYRFTGDSLDRALRLLRNGLQIAGENALLYALMGNIYLQYVNSLIKPEERYLQQAQECADRIFALDPASSYGHWLRGALCHKRGDVQEAVRHHKRALAADPRNADAMYWLSYAYRVSGKEFAARPLVQQLVWIDPLTPYSHWASGWIDFFEGHVEEALNAFRKMYELDPESPFNQWAYGFMLAAALREEQAYSLLDLVVRDVPDTFYGRHGLFLKLALQRDKVGALQAVTEELAGTARWDDQVSWMMAICYAMVDEKIEALNWLENAVRLGFVNYPFLSRDDGFLQEIRGEARFRSLMEQVKRRWEQFEI